MNIFFKKDFNSKKDTFIIEEIIYIIDEEGAMAKKKKAVKKKAVKKKPVKKKPVKKKTKKKKK